ncbi:MAG: hypothetical protein E6Q97_35845 [Desulfurellales bacterium]|nr:MAG: hypothetical protein E6Q97_35845 [Desulfurellales bacterium]
MSKFEVAEIGSICLVQQTEDGRIRQIAITTEQHRMLQIFLAILSKEHPLVQMEEDRDLVLKKTLCKKCRAASVNK